MILWPNAVGACRVASMPPTIMRLAPRRGNCAEYGQAHYAIIHISLFSSAYTVWGGGEEEGRR